MLALLDAELRAGTIEVQTINLETLPTIEADADQLKWMFTNLVKNAAQAMDRGGTIAVEGFVDMDAEAIRVAVRDTGVGMSTETAERAFIPFFTTKDKGTGLGLAIVKRLVEHRRGTMLTSGSSPRPTKTCPTAFGKEPSAKICSTASMWCPLRSCPCANAAQTSRCSWLISCSSTTPRSARRCRRCIPAQWSC